MCKLFPSFYGLWRSYNFVLSIFCTILSSVLGPAVSLVYYAAGPDGGPATLCREERDYCILVTNIHYLMWIFFCASVLQFLSCWFKSTCLLHCSMGLNILDILLSIILFTRYLIHCSVFDRQCLSHKEDDILLVSNLFVLNLLHVLFLGTVLFFMGQYKTSLQYRYFGFVLF